MTIPGRTRLMDRSVDLENYLWLPSERGVLFAETPVYGAPGIYLFTLADSMVTRLVEPRTLSDSAYPDGADYFVLCSVSAAADGTERFTYVRAAHVDSMDIATLLAETPPQEHVVPGQP